MNTYSFIIDLKNIIVCYKAFVVIKQIYIETHACQWIMPSANTFSDYCQVSVLSMSSAGMNNDS